MGIEYYLFTIFVFALLCMLLFLYRRVIVAHKGKKASEEDVEKEREKEERLFRLYQNIEEMMDNFEAYIEDTREQMEAMKTEMRQQAERENDLLRRVEATEAKALAAVAALRPQEKPEQKKEAQPDGGRGPEGGKRANRQDSVRELLSKGMTVEQIAQKLELSINEVRLTVYGLMTKKAERKQ